MGRGLRIGDYLQNKRYYITSFLNRGGQAIVYQALDYKLGCRVVIKETLTGKKWAHEGFEREAIMLSNERYSSVAAMSQAWRGATEAKPSSGGYRLRLVQREWLEEHQGGVRKALGLQLGAQSNQEDKAEATHVLQSEEILYHDDLPGEQVADEVKAPAAKLVEFWDAFWLLLLSPIISLFAIIYLVFFILNPKSSMLVEEIREARAKSPQDFRSTYTWIGIMLIVVLIGLYPLYIIIEFGEKMSWWWSFPW